MAIRHCQPQVASPLQKIQSARTWPVRMYRTWAILKMPSSIELMYEAFQFILHYQVAVTGAIRPSGLDAIPYSALRHGITQPKARCTSKGSCLVSM